MKLNFVKTKDENSRLKLEKSGFTFLGEQEGYYVFLNDKPIKFDETEIKKLIYTNIACL